jgi:quercetin dioxygenase-like cupin family protein
MVIKNFFPNEDIKVNDTGDGVKRKINAYNDNLMCVEVYFDQGAIGKPHSHPHEQINYVVKGKFEIEINGVRKVCSVGDSTYIQPDVVHSCLCVEEGMMLNIFTPCREDFVNHQDNSD